MITDAKLQVVLTSIFVAYIAAAKEYPRNPGFVDSSSAGKWETAAESCRNHTSYLPVLRNAQNVDIAGLKKDIHMQPGSDVWTGDYKTFEVVIPQTNKPFPSSGLLCVSATLTSLQALKKSMRYGFNLTLTECLEKKKYMCTCTSVDSAKNVSILYVKKSVSGSWQNAFTSCSARGSICSLWLPDLSVYKTVVDGDIGHGTIELGDSNNDLMLHERYWTIIRIKESRDPAHEHFRTCGYITYTEARVLYGSCDQMKRFVCEKFKDHKNQLAVKSKVKKRNTAEVYESAPRIGWMYGVAIGCGIIIVGLIAALVLLKKWKRKTHGNEQGILSKLPCRKCCLDSRGECTRIEEGEDADGISIGSGYMIVSGNGASDNAVYTIA